MALGKWFGKKKKDEPTEPAREGSDHESSALASKDGATNDGATKDGAAAEPPAVEAKRDTDEKPKKRSMFSALRQGLKKTTQALKSALSFGRKLDADALEEIEATLIQADFGPVLAMELTEALADSYRDKEFVEEEVVPFLKERLRAKLGEPQPICWAKEGPTIILVTGVNGTGKTTSIAKLANSFKRQGKRVAVAAADTFRAAAVEQLRIWSERIGVEMIAGEQDGDPAAVVYDALDRAKNADLDVLLIDTAGRLHTQVNLMNQLDKMRRVIQKRYPDAPHEVLQVLDATTGQNAIRQADEFKKAVEVTGLVLTKLDGTARGGVVFPILDAIGLPVKYIGVGEGLEDLQPFDPTAFVDALFGDGEPSEQ